MTDTPGSSKTNYRLPNQSTINPHSPSANMLGHEQSTCPSRITCCYDTDTHSENSTLREVCKEGREKNSKASSTTHLHGRKGRATFPVSTAPSTQHQQDAMTIDHRAQLLLRWYMTRTTCISNLLTHLNISSSNGMIGVLPAH
jgi:hypothetical protein